MTNVGKLPAPPQDEVKAPALQQHQPRSAARMASRKKHEQVVAAERPRFFQGDAESSGEETASEEQEKKENAPLLRLEQIVKLLTEFGDLRRYHELAIRLRAVQLEIF